MKFGDLSNDLAPIVGFRFEKVIKKSDGKLNKQVKSYMQDVLLKTGCNLYILTTGDRKKALSFCVKYNIPWTQVIEIDSVLEIPEVCIENKMIVYYDNDGEVVYNVNSRGKERVTAQAWT